MVTPSHDDDARSDADEGGQVSETSVMDHDEGPQEVQPHDATAGGPSDESGEPQEGTAGPNASPEENRGLSEQESPAP